jgi:peptide-methionine (R)-S-oxide reductase
MYSNSVTTYRQRSIVLLALFVTAAATPWAVEAFHAAPAAKVSSRSNTMCFSSKKADDTEGNTVDPSPQNPAGFQVKTFNPLRLAVLRLGLTEPAWTSPLNYGAKVGTFSCAYCGHELFDSTGKYDSGSGWPSFWRSVKEGAISYKMEYDGRLEIQCGRCKSHLGHVFPDGPRESEVPTDLLQQSPPTDPRGKQGNGRLPRYCVNGASINFQPRDV